MIPLPNSAAQFCSYVLIILTYVDHTQRNHSTRILITYNYSLLKVCRIKTRNYLTIHQDAEHNYL